MASGQYYRLSPTHPRDYSGPDPFQAEFEESQYEGFRERDYHTKLTSDVRVTPLKSESKWKPLLKLLPKLFALAWLLPVAILLYLNFTTHIIGASAWCPSGRCRFDPFSKDVFEKSKHYNRETHNLFGVLQLVAKFLEIWFIIIASGFVYAAFILLARRNSGLPLAFYPSAAEFTDPRFLLSSKLWKAPSGSQLGYVERSRASNKLLWLFLAFLLFMGLVANLMGPAIAILLLPSLIQHKTHPQAERVFGAIDSTRPPSGDEAIPYCMAQNLTDSNYDCAYYTYTLALDAWIASGKAYDFQIPYVVSRWPNGTNPASNYFASSQALFAVSQEWGVSLAFNASSDDHVFWAPNRQVLRNLTGDLENFYQTIKEVKEDHSIEALRATQDPVLKLLTDGDSTNGFLPVKPDETFKQLTNSLETILQRNGPVIGAEINFFQSDNFYVTAAGSADGEDDQPRTVLCMDGWSPLAAADPNWQATKCYGVGTGWTGVDFEETWNHALTIPLQNSYVTTIDNTNITLTLEMFYSDRAAYFNSTTRHEQFKEYKKKGCIPTEKGGTVNATDAQCDWDDFFNVGYLNDLTEPNDFSYVIGNSHVIMLQLNNVPGLDDTTASSRFIIEFNPALAIADYSLDTSPFTNAIRLVNVANMPKFSKAEPIYIHPSWLVAMFGGYKNTDKKIRIQAEDRVSPFTTDPSNSALEILNSMLDIALSFPGGSKDLYGSMRESNVTALVQYRSLFYITYLTTLHLCSILPFSTTEIQSGSDKEAVTLHRSAITEVWAYNLDSRTSKFGVVIVALGSLITVAYFIVGLTMRIRERTTASIMAACLRHPPQDEFTTCGVDETKLGSVRFMAEKDPTRMWKFRKVV